MNKFYIILGVAVLIMIGVVWKSSGDRKAREEAFAQQAEQHKQKMAQLEAENQAKLVREAQEKAQQEQERIEYNNRAKVEQANFEQSHPTAIQTTIQNKDESGKLDKIKEIENKVREMAFDPDSAKFRKQVGNCGEVNAKNRMGGYVGYRRFIYNPETDTVSIEDEKDGLYNPKMMNILWDAKCLN